MHFERIYDEDLAQASYLIGCQATGEAIAVDPRRDAQTFTELAARHGLRITAVAETHIHADYLSGSREQAHRTGATLYLSDEGDADWKYGFEGVKLYHGSEIRIGNITVRAVHTPGHTPEHLSFLVTDGATTEQPGFMLTGDFVFVGDVGRPDLLDEAAGGVDTRFGGAKRLYESLRDHFLTLPDHIQVWPGHGAGSACGKALGAVPVTTVGYERMTSWWAPLVAAGDLEGFVTSLLEGQPDAPLYFGRMKRLNKAGPPILGERPALRRLGSAELAGRLADELLLLDTRDGERHRADHVPGALYVPEGKNFAAYASFAIDPESDRRSIVLLAQDEAQAEWMRHRLAWTGIDDVIGYVTDLEGLTAGPVPTVAPEALDRVQDRVVLDVRNQNEFRAGHIPGAMQLDVGRIAYRSERVPRDRPVIVHCQSGGRSPVAAAVLRAKGFDVSELAGSFDAYLEAGYQPQRDGASSAPAAAQAGAREGAGA
jgi:hydroxyacylglutathione hydrolase